MINKTDGESNGISIDSWLRPWHWTWKINRFTKVYLDSRNRLFKNLLLIYLLQQYACFHRSGGARVSRRGTYSVDTCTTLTLTSYTRHLPPETEGRCIYLEKRRLFFFIIFFSQKKDHFFCEDSMVGGGEHVYCFIETEIIWFEEMSLLCIRFALVSWKYTHMYAYIIKIF